MSNSSGSIRVKPADMESEFYRILIKNGLPAGKAKACAELFTTNTLEGVYTHGVYRFQRFVEYIQKGFINPNVDAICKNSFGGVEQWDGQSGIGPTNAIICTDRAIALASKNGIGCVALAFTNHWMRGGAYGWKAAKAGYVFIGWTNTIANMPTWGAIDSRLGNNPLVMALPHQQDAIVLDMAMSQYSYGALELRALKKEKLPVPGGYDKNGNISEDPEAIIESRRTLPVGYWKGAGLSLLLDLLAVTLSGGLSTADITRQPAECNVSQVFIAIDISRLGHFKALGEMVQKIIDDYHQSVPVNNKEKIRYPGERVLHTRAENELNGIPVIKKVWGEIQAL
jgi:3-dehydro-L-gulonate 2-dehydrogenase